MARHSVARSSVTWKTSLVTTAPVGMSTITGTLIPPS
jgi:hypothetical protein